MMACSAGCATAYKLLRFGGGYQETEFVKARFEVRFASNAYTSKARVYSYLLRLCAQLAHALGYPFFTVTQDQTRLSDASIHPQEPERTDIEQQITDGYATSGGARAMGPTLAVQPTTLERYTASHLMQGWTQTTRPAGAYEAAAVLVASDAP